MAFWLFYSVLIAIYKTENYSNFLASTWSLDTFILGYTTHLHSHTMTYKACVAHLNKVSNDRKIRVVSEGLEKITEHASIAAITSI